MKYFFHVDGWAEENEWADETGGDDDMDYEPTTEGESEDMPDIFQQLLEAAEEEDDGDEDDEFHGLMEDSPAKILALTLW
jgi:hypothetical protein